MGLSICARKALSCQNSTASQAAGAKAAARRKKLEGMWVKTIVLSRPILLAILAASAPLVGSAVLKIGYDLSLYAMFRNVRPPEEVRMLEARARRQQAPET